MQMTTPEKKRDIRINLSRYEATEIYGLLGAQIGYLKDRAESIHHRGSANGFDDALTAGERDHWMQMANIAIKCMPGLMNRVAGRCVAHSKVLRSLQRATRAEKKKAEKKLGVPDYE